MRLRHILTMARLRIMLIAALAIMSSSGSAYIPRGPLPEVGWDGPGHLCEASFTLKVERGEYVREDVQLEPWYPASNTIKSSDGWYSISELHEMPEKSENLRKVISNDHGEIYSFKLTDSFSFSARFIFTSRDKDKPPIEVQFFLPTHPRPASSDWRIAPQKPYDPARYQSVLNRVDFSSAPQTDCLNH